MNKQDYYEYDPTESGAWWKKDPPAPEPWFQAELNLVAGFSDGKYPKLRVSWGGTIMHDITAKPQLKYKVTREVTTGYNYVKENGDIGFTKSMNLPDDAKVPWEFHPKKELIDLGRLRWVIERHVPANELARLGRFKNLHAPDGEKILRSLPSEGVYDHFFWVQTAAHRYRDLDNQVLTAVLAMYLYNINTSEAQKQLDAEERDSNMILLGDKQFESVFN